MFAIFSRRKRMDAFLFVYWYSMCATLCWNVHDALANCVKIYFVTRAYCLKIKCTRNGLRCLTNKSTWRRSLPSFHLWGYYIASSSCPFELVMLGGLRCVTVRTDYWSFQRTVASDSAVDPIVLPYHVSVGLSVSDAAQLSRLAITIYPTSFIQPLFHVLFNVWRMSVANRFSSFEH